MKTKKYIYIAILMPFLLLLTCCESFLDVKPQGTVEESMLLTQENANSHVTAAYAMLNDMGGAGIQADTWYSAIRSGDNYKGEPGRLILEDTTLQKWLHLYWPVTVRQQ